MSISAINEKQSINNRSPLKVIYHKKDILQNQQYLGKHGYTYIPRHVGNENGYRLYVAHYHPRHAKIVNKQSKVSVPLVKNVVKNHIPTEVPKVLTPPRNFVSFKSFRDEIEDFDLEEYRARREKSTIKQRICKKNYFREFSYIFLILQILILILFMESSMKWVEYLLYLNFVCFLVITLTALYFHFQPFQKKKSR